MDDDEWGTRIFTGHAVDAFMWKTGQIPGYVVAVWKGRHVAEPTQLTALENANYWVEISQVGRAVEACFQPAKMNYLTLGNSVPHLHTHIVPRPWSGDPNPNGPLLFDALDHPRQADNAVRTNAVRVRQVLQRTSPGAESNRHRGANSG